MTERINSALTEAESAEFAHTAEWMLECNAASSSVTMEVRAKIEASADWVLIDSFTPAATPIRRYVACPYIKLKFTGNAGLATIKAWSV